MRRSLFVAALLCVTTCPAWAAEPLTAAAAAESDKPIVKLATPETVLATRGDAVLLVADIDAFVNQVPVRDRAASVGTEERVTTLLQNLLLNRQLANEVRKLGLDKDPKVQREIMLAAEKVLARRALAHFVESQPQPNLEQLARETYLSDKSKFVAPEMRTVQHILINNKDRSDAEAQELVKKVAAEAKAPGAKFQDLVDKYSDDQAKINNHGFYTIDPSVEGQMDPSFVAGAKTLSKIGDTTEPVGGMYGYHLIQLSGYREARQLSFDEVKATLTEQLRMAWAKRAEEEHTEVLRAQNPEVDVEVAESLKTRYLQAPLLTPPATAGN